MAQRNLIAVAVLALALQACQQGGAKPQTQAAAPATTAAKPKAEEYVATEVFEGRQKELGYKFAEKLLRGCKDQMSSEGGLKTCFRERTLAAFDNSGLAADSCPARTDDLDGELTCIVTGSIGYEFAQNIGGDATKKFVWSDPEGSINTIVVDFLLGELQSCMDGSSASSADDCLTKAFVEKMKIPDGDVQKCMALDDDFKQGQCLGEAYAVNYMAAGIEKL